MENVRTELEIQITDLREEIIKYKKLKKDIKNLQKQIFIYIHIHTCVCVCV